MSRRAWLSLAALGVLAACGDAQPPTAQQPTGVQPQAAPAAAAPAVGAKSRWPYTDPAQAAASAGVDPASAIRRNYYVVFDASGSMLETRCSDPENKITVAKRALAEFAGKLPPDVNFGLSVFDGSGIRELLPLAPIAADAVATAIAPIRAGGATPLVASMRRAAQALTEQGRRQFGYGEFHLVVVTDGESTDGSPGTVVDEVLASSPIVLHTVGFCIGSNHSLNQPGKVVYRPADNPAELAKGLADVLAESPAFAASSFK
jgi:Ca-activated chloride channel family protein